MPGRGDYGEVTSTSNTTDYQARRLRIRYRKDGGRPQLLHTLNGTALAISRTLIALLEIYQQEDGSVMLPKALIPYVGKERIEAAS
jgi:seryl-tRNA synthetase